MKNYFKKVLGLDKLEEDIAEAKRLKEEAAQALTAAQEAERVAKLSPKELATEREEPWIEILKTHVNKENVRNGFFELDWNEYFVLQLKSAGYVGSTDEEIVDKWFQELCRNVGSESGIDMERRGSGFVNRALRDDGLTEIS
jgi:hypothetical protein